MMRLQNDAFHQDKDRQDMQEKTLIAGLSRREFLRRGLICAGVVSSPSLLLGCGSEGDGGSTVMGGGTIVPPLQSTADANGLLLPEGYVSRVIAQAAQMVPNTTQLLPLLTFPDGAASFPDPEVAGGWIHVINSEVPKVPSLLGMGLDPLTDPLISALQDLGLELSLSGGVFAIRFSPEGDITGAYRLLNGSNTNCAGGMTPWGTWISCEEVDNGTSFEVHPLGQGMINGVEYPIRLDNLGIFKHEAAAVDPLRKHVYLTEDQGDGRFYRLVSSDSQPWDGSVKGDLSLGTLQVAQVVGDDPAATRDVIWHDLPDPSGATPTREQVAASTIFDGGEGCWYHEGIVYFTTKGDNRVWAYDVVASTLDVLYDDDQYESPVLTGVDNVIVSPEGNVIVAEDGGDMQAVVLTPGGQVAPIVQVQGQDASEITGLALNPDGTRLYFNSQRGGDIRIPIPELPGLPISGEVGGGIIYEIRREDGGKIFG